LTPAFFVLFVSLFPALPDFSQEIGTSGKFMKYGLYSCRGTCQWYVCRVWGACIESSPFVGHMHCIPV
jgi:hypothetical protein